MFGQELFMDENRFATGMFFVFYFSFSFSPPIFQFMILDTFSTLFHILCNDFSYYSYKDGEEFFPGESMESQAQFGFSS